MIYATLVIKLSMFNSRESIGSRARLGSSSKTSLGNRETRYNSQVISQRRKYVISSTQNSEDVPEWMSRTQSHHFRSNNNNKSIFNNARSPFKHVEQTYVYARLPKPQNANGQFEQVRKNRIRSRWELKDQTFEFQWPKNERHLKEQKANISRMTMYESSTQRPSSRPNEIMRINLPKYAYKQSPLHVQKQTPIKIGHPYMLNSTYIK